MRIPLLLAALIGLAEPALAQRPTLDAVRARGTLICATNPGLPGFAAPGPDGVYQGLDADTCRAVAVAVFGDATRVTFRPVATPDATRMLREREADVVARNLNLSMSREVEEGGAATAINFHDTQGFLVRRSLNAETLAQLAGMRVCVSAGTMLETGLEELVQREGLRLTIAPIAGFTALRDAYFAGQCDAVSGGTQAVAVIRASAPDPAAHVVLRDMVGRAPYGPMVRQGDNHWRSLVFWTVNALLEAEDLGITAANVAEMRASPSARIRRLLGAEPGIGTPLGLADDWVFQVIRQVGNYGDVFERNMGQGSPLRMDRGLNHLFTSGGLMYPIPMR